MAGAGLIFAFDISAGTPQKKKPAAVAGKGHRPRIARVTSDLVERRGRQLLLPITGNEKPRLVRGSLRRQIPKLKRPHQAGATSTKALYTLTKAKRSKLFSGGDLKREKAGPS
jgi:hypothetical protein